MQEKTINKTLRFMGTMAIGLASLPLAAACSGSSASPGTGPSELTASMSLVIPNQSLADWVSYAHQVSVVSVVSEAEIEPPPEVRARKEGYIGRTVTVRLEDTLWVAPGAEALSGELTMTVIGWHLKGDRKLPFGGRLEVGNRYLVPLASIKGRWAGMTVGNPVLVEDTRVAMRLREAKSWISELAGVSLADVRKRLAETAPDPVAVRFAHLPGGERAEAVRQAKGQAGVNP